MRPYIFGDLIDLGCVSACIECISDSMKGGGVDVITLIMIVKDIWERGQFLFSLFFFF